MRDGSNELSAASSLPDTIGADVVRASWRRCVSEYGMDRSQRRPVERIGNSAVRELRERMEDILVQASPVVDGMRRIAADTEHVILLSNADGIVVTSFADSPGSQDVAMAGLNTGSIWSEQKVGTNGIGTCLISRQPLTVFGGAHFNENFATFTCSAAPIFGPDGQVIAAFDISGRAIPGSGEGRFAQYFAREAASQISMMLFRRWHRDDCIVALTPDADPMPMSAKALIATDESGYILGATQEALSFLGIPDLSDIGARYISDIWNVSFNDLRPLSKHSMRLSGPSGTSTFVTAFLPKKKPTSTPSRGATLPALQEKVARVQNTIGPLDKVAGTDPVMLQNISLCRKIIDKDIPLLLLGETGVGKDTLARALHAESKRADKPYVAVNCAAIPATLLASELFGYAPGTFTGGAKGGRTGKILASHGGTLFLDEIGDMPLDLQAHLLRVLEERTVTPLGSSDTIPVDMKIVCATHRNLPDNIAKGLFRKDLYYRIRGAQIVLPSLKDRADLPRLITSIVSDETAPGCVGVTFSDEVMTLFCRYPWPGNIRELRNVLRFLTTLHDGKMIEIDDLPEQILDFSRAIHPDSVGDTPCANKIDQRWPDIQNRDSQRFDAQAPELPVRERRDTPQAPSSSSTSGGTLSESNEAAERRRIVEVLRTNRWNVTEAAGQLGISRATLHRKIRRYAITSPNNQD